MVSESKKSGKDYTKPETATFKQRKKVDELQKHMMKN